jgi:hypothetical protein
MKEKIKLLLVTMLLSKWILLQLKTQKRIKIALFIHRNNLSPQTQTEKYSNDFDAKYTEVLIDLGFRTLVEKIQNQGALSGYYQKSQQRRFLL